MNISRLNIYIATLLIQGGFAYIMGIISRIKEPMAETLNLSSSFLGLLDGIMFAGAAIGSAYTALSPFKKPVKTILVFSLSSAFCMQINILSGMITPLKESILLFSRILFGFFFVTPIISQTVNNYYFHKV